MINTLYESVMSLFFPNCCLVCGETLISQEKQICMECLHRIPATSYHLQVDNPMEKRFWGKVTISHATAFFFFQKGSPYRKLLHELKYKGNTEIGRVLGAYAALQLLENPDYSAIDLIIPVPLHPAKQKLRGYNQSEVIARGMAAIMQKQVCTNVLCRVRENPTQTRKSVFERYENTAGLFCVDNSELIAGKNILLVDDVVTTGSTLEACIQQINQVDGAKVWVFALALA